MTLWMINVRMRRVEEVFKHPRCTRTGPLKCYQGPGRTYMLFDKQLHSERPGALVALCTELKAIHADRNAKQLKLKAEIDEISRELDK